METKTSTADKMIEFQRDLENEKKFSMWKILIGTILFLVCMQLFTDDVKDFIINGIIMFLAWLLFFRDRVRDMNMARLEKKLGEKVKEEEKYLADLKNDYGKLCHTSFEHIPQRLRKTAIYLLSQEDESPEAVIVERNQKVLDMETQLVCYRDCRERTFWQYLLSWKWLKKS